MVASIVFGSSIRQVRPTLSYWIEFMEVCISLEGRTKCSGGLLWGSIGVIMGERIKNRLRRSIVVAQT